MEIILSKWLRPPPPPCFLGMTLTTSLQRVVCAVQLVVCLAARVFFFFLSVFLVGVFVAVGVFVFAVLSLSVFASVIQFQAQN